MSSSLILPSSMPRGYRQCAATRQQLTYIEDEIKQILCSSTQCVGLVIPISIKQQNPTDKNSSKDNNNTLSGIYIVEES